MTVTEEWAHAEQARTTTGHRKLAPVTTSLIDNSVSIAALLNGANVVARLCEVAAGATADRQERVARIIFFLQDAKAAWHRRLWELSSGCPCARAQGVFQ